MTHKFILPMCRREALLVKHTEKPLCHWFYVKKDYPNIEVWDRVQFECQGEIIATGVVSHVGLLKENYPDWCTGLNDAGFEWMQV